jgi:hypothetical protein
MDSNVFKFEPEGGKISLTELEEITDLVKGNVRFSHYVNENGVIELEKIPESKKQDLEITGMVFSHIDFLPERLKRHFKSLTIKDNMFNLPN